MAGEFIAGTAVRAGRRHISVRLAGMALGVAGAVVLPSLAFAHIVAPGETLSDIADRYGVSVDDLARENGIENPDLIYAGEEIHVGEASAATIPVSHHSAVPYATHVVEEGDTLTAIAARYAVSMDAIAEANGIEDANQIFISQVLTIPGGTPVARVSRAEAEAILRSAEAEFGLPRGLLLALAWQESGWQQGIVSDAGAVGITQILPDTADWAIEQFVPDAHNWQGSARDNARMGAAVLAYYLHRTGGDVRLSLAAYYQGWRSVEQRGMFEETRDYVDNVLALIHEYQ